MVYERLIHTSDDHKDAVTAEVSIWRHGEKINTVYPAKWDFHKDEGQATTEVAITVLVAEDIYVVLTGYDLDTGLANLRVYINPLILWVWVGFLILAFGTLVCLIPQTAVDRLARPRASRLGRAADVGLLILVVGGVLAGLSTQAHAAQPPAEHVQPGMGMGADGVGYAAMNRPTNSTQERAMKELLCVCGCARESFFDCKCGSAAQLRKEVMDYLGQTDATGKPVFDLSTEAGREIAYNTVLEYFVAQYHGEQVLATPRTKFSWLFPSVAVIGGLGLLVVAGRRWVGRGSAMPATNAAGGPTAATPESKPTIEDESYVDKLDDELADTE